MTRRFIQAYAFAVSLIGAHGLARVSTRAEAQQTDGSGVVRVIDAGETVPGYRARQELRRSYPESRPGARGFRAMVFSPAAGGSEPIGGRWSFEVGRDGETAARKHVADLVAKRLAADGLPMTFARVEYWLAARDPTYLTVPYRDRESVLRGIGLPTDLLSFFVDDSASERESIGVRIAGDPPPLVRAVDEAVAAGRSENEVIAMARARRFVFRPTQPGYRAATESGEHAIGWVRLQASAGSYYEGPGDGGCLDVFHQLLAALPDARFIISVERKHAGGLLGSLRGWAVPRQNETIVIIEDFPLSQWAQDNGKPGTVLAPGEIDQAASPLTLVPRYASRGEEASIFVTGDSFVCEGVAEAGLPFAQSPLLFQGGNLLAVWDAARRKRVLLVGEAEIQRNVSLGLTAAEVEAALAIEFGCEETVVLPAVSYHIDYEVAVRNVNGRPVVLMNDELAAAREIVRLGLARLASSDSSGPLPLDARTSLARSRAMLDRSNDREAGAAAAECLERLAVQPGQWPLDLVRCFAVGSGESAVGNFNLFMASVDILHTAGATESSFAGADHASSYFRSLIRRRAQRQDITQALTRLGWEVVAVPSLADSEQSLCYLNGIQSRSHYFMPAYGGMFVALDSNAAALIARAWGEGVKVVPIRCGESLRRDGGIHCSASVYPAQGGPLTLGADRRGP
ncbi:MAG: hypothetical protein HBSAPP02_21300 [Phycisphaerae bacterium]|nr:MAG: hypothetical protein HRU71_05600 [Planctomycetia bacterium]GJQ27098.1 MAG: hypothetical protein HBSAPP02_21300 [Phycisphaerae bacterium]